ncbi:MAG: diacylglycerol kinase family protein [Clostridiales bacterium]|jgi:diacylglycerol kinase (ATP)|nr:diacylglycerol kinase family protein [Clostridiales bacterium]
MKSPNLPQSFKFAFSGVMETLKNERNFKLHVCAAICALGLAIFLKISVIEFICLLISIALVLSAELINTAIESVVDLFAGEQINALAKAAKDAAAGAVLITALNAAAVGAAVFLKRLIYRAP